MVAPTISNIFQIGIDNALIQVPQNYTVPANPPSIPNPPEPISTPTNVSSTTTTSDSITVYLSAIKGFDNILTLYALIQPITSELASELGYNLSNLDSTTAPWQGFMGVTPSDWVSASTMTATSNGLFANLNIILQANAGNSLNTYVALNYQTLFINPGTTGGAINPAHPPSYLVSLYALDPITNTYAACNFTLVVLPSVADYGLGVYSMAQIGSNYIYVNSVSLKPSGSVLLGYYFYPLEPTSAAPLPLNITVDWFNSPIIDQSNSTVINSAGPDTGHPISFESYTTADGTGAVAGGFTRDSLAFQKPLFTGTSTSATTTVMTDNSQALVPDSLVGRILRYSTGPAAGLIHPILSNSSTTITTTAFSPAPNTGANGYSVYQQQYGSIPLQIVLYLNSSASSTNSNPIYTHALLQVTGTDANGVSVSAYTVVYVAGEAT